MEDILVDLGEDLEVEGDKGPYGLMTIQEIEAISAVVEDVGKINVFYGDSKIS